MKMLHCVRSSRNYFRTYERPTCHTSIKALDEPSRHLDQQAKPGCLSATAEDHDGQRVSSLDRPRYPVFQILRPLGSQFRTEITGKPMLSRPGRVSEPCLRCRLFWTAGTEVRGSDTRGRDDVGTVAYLRRRFGYREGTLRCLLGGQ